MFTYVILELKYFLASHSVTCHSEQKDISFKSKKYRSEFQ